MIYDKAKYHSDGDFPKDLPESQSYIPAGLFVAWLAENNFLNDEIASNFGMEIAALLSREETPSTLYRIVGGVLEDDMLTDEGNQFTADYFDFDKGKYLDDLFSVLGSKKSSLYHIEDSWNNYDRLARRISSRYRTWKERERR